jgi:hypothetical protein
MEAASRFRRIRLEELKRRKQQALTSNGANGHAAYRDSSTVIEFDEDEKEDEASIKQWSTTKLVRSFRLRDAKLNIDYNQLKDTIEKGE